MAKSYNKIAQFNQAQGSLLGQLAGDSLGSLVEFQSPSQIAKRYPNGVTELADGGTWNTVAGQPTDDSEMALALARLLVQNQVYTPEVAKQVYIEWLDSDPFDCGLTISAGLRGNLNPNSQANGAMMRVCPLAIWGAKHDLKQVAEWAMQDAAITHPNIICQQANALYAMAIAYAIQSESDNRSVYDSICKWANELNVDRQLKDLIAIAAEQPPQDLTHQQGWVCIAFQNALWQLLHAPSLQAGITDTVMRGGDTDTNAAICGALLGAVYGIDQVPKQWLECILNCKPEQHNPNVQHPRPQQYWPCDALDLAKQLLA
ncbi:ADP-ribosylglycohydrolase family protein [Planctomycetota bacterium]|nr:ADP-ribosylglycohydrolase family protein [Planctomycetota bacterium]